MLILLPTRDITNTSVELKSARPKLNVLDLIGGKYELKNLSGPFYDRRFGLCRIGAIVA
jgi:hypothetical protein